MNNEQQPLVYKPVRRQWPGLLAVGLVVGAIAAAVVSNQDSDAPAAATSPAAPAATAGAIPDEGITAAVKTSLAADPALGTLPINVTTQGGVVSLEGPAPDAQARERASSLASASAGVVRVDNKLVVTPAS